MSERELERRPSACWGCCAMLRKCRERGGDLPLLGISRQCYYVWRRRYDADGVEGLKDRSSRPPASPKATQAEVVEKIL